jgi:4-hydroxy-tetrahydrodipicolinate synthase
MSEPTLRGCGTALVTPFKQDLGVDENALRALVDWQIEQGIHFLVPCGSTGEAATMSRAEVLRVVRIVAEQANGRVPVLGGVSGNDTAATVELAKEVAAQGPSHLMVVGPPYNRPPQRGFIAHFERIADAVDVPIVLYNVPGVRARTSSRKRASRWPSTRTSTGSKRHPATWIRSSS